MSPSPIKVLLVEDSPSDAGLVCEALNETSLERFDFTRAESWAEASKQLHGGQFDVVLLDLSLPDSSGRDTFMRARQAAADLPIVIMSGVADEAVSLEAVRYGIQDYLIKGQTDGRQTSRAIRYAIERQRAETALKHTETALRESERKLIEVNQQLELRVAERTAQLEQTVSDLEDFSYTITHDLRAPLRAMGMFCQMLREECGVCVRPAAQDYTRRIIGAAARMDKLILDVLQYSRLTRTELALTPVDVSALLRGIIESYPNLHAPGIEIRVEEPLPAVLGNEAALTQCFSNLLGNAVKFVAPGVQPRVRIRAETVHSSRSTVRGPEATGSAAGAAESTERQTAASSPRQSNNPTIPQSTALVRLWFEDNGIGIPKAAQEKIFDLFQQLDRACEGTGVGLTIVRKAVEKMGGKVGVESERGRGSRFWLELKAAYDVP